MWLETWRENLLLISESSADYLELKKLKIICNRTSQIFQGFQEVTEAIARERGQRNALGNTYGNT